MPEGPETARSTDKLRQSLNVGGKWMYLVNAFRYGDRFSNVDICFLRNALDKPIVDIFCKGKEYFICLANNITIHAHHGMEGHWRIENDQDPSLVVDNTHFRFDFKMVLPNNYKSNPYSTTSEFQPDLVLYFVNVRLGSLEIMTSKKELDDAVNRLAPSFIGNNKISMQEWLMRISTINKGNLIRVALMDQKQICCGIGNYLLIELLYFCRLNPETSFGQLSQNKLEEMYHIFDAVINGHYKKTLVKVIYQKKKCPNGHDLTKSKVGGRTFYHCPVEQTFIL